LKVLTYNKTCYLLFLVMLVDIKATLVGILIVNYYVLFN